MKNINFPCNRCGACCRHVNKAKETQFLDRGDAVCQYYNENKKLCSIYHDRPDICRVDTQYKLNYSKHYSWNEFIALNSIACRIILENE